MSKMNERAKSLYVRVKKCRAVEQTRASLYFFFLIVSLIL